MHEHLSRFDSPVPLTLGQKVDERYAYGESDLNRCTGRFAPPRVEFVEHEAVTPSDCVARPRYVLVGRAVNSRFAQPVVYQGSAQQIREQRRKHQVEECRDHWLRSFRFWCT